MTTVPYYFSPIHPSDSTVVPLTILLFGTLIFCGFVLPWIMGQRIEMRRFLTVLELTRGKDLGTISGEVEKRFEVTVPFVYAEAMLNKLQKKGHIRRDGELFLLTVDGADWRGECASKATQTAS